MRTGYINANIYGTDATAFLVDEDRIVIMGKDSEIQKYLTIDEEIVDLQGNMVVPGFIDTHMHLVSLGEFLASVNLFGTKSLKETEKRIREYIQENQDKSWIDAQGYNDDLFEEKGTVTKEFLDEICDDKPVVVSRVCGHVNICNSEALRLAGITEYTEVDGGHIDFASGRVEENAIGLISKVRPEITEKEIEEYIRRGMAYCSRFGITAVGSDDLTSAGKDFRKVLHVYEKMSYQEELTVRVNEQCRFNSVKDFASFLDDGYTTDVGNDYFKIGPLKLLTDGSLGARTAALSRPYSDAPETSGYLSMQEDEIRLYTELAARFNMPAICHAIGDDAVDTVLRVFKDIVYEGNPLHHGLVHCQILRPAQIQRILDMKLSCYFQSLFIDYDATILKDRVGDFSDSCYPFATLFRGTLASNGSDCPVEIPDVLKGIQLAVTRCSSHEGFRMNPAECLSAEEALQSYTINGAKQFFMDDMIGSLEAGKMADFAVLDKDILTCPENEISSAKVLMTVMAGKRVYER